MTEQTAETPAQPDPTQEQAGATPPNPDPAPAAAPEVDWRERAEAQQKVNRDLERKLNDLRGGLAKAFGLQDGEKPEPDALAQRVNTLQERLDAAERRSRLLDLAAQHDIPKDYQHLLTATDDETLRAQAVAVGELVKGKTPATPAPDPSQGAQPLTPEAQAEAEYQKFFPSAK